MKPKSISILLVTLALLLSSCGAEQSQPTQIENTSTPTLPPTQTPSPTVIPSPMPTQIGGSDGWIIYDNSPYGASTNPSIIIANLATGRGKYLTPNLNVLQTQAGEKSYYNFSLSPNAKNFFIESTTCLDKQCASFSTDQHITNLNLSSVIKLEEKEKVFSWKWSPDSKKLAGVSEGTSNISHAYIVNSDGTILLDIKTAEHSNLFWSPDSSSIYLYQGIGANGKRDLRLVDLIASQEKNIEIEGTDGTIPLECATFSPDGKKVSFSLVTTHSSQSFSHQIYIANVDFTAAVLLAEFESTESGCDTMSWSQDQKYLYALSSKKCNIQAKSCKREIFLFNTSSGEMINGTPEDFSKFCGWSPDGSFAYLSAETLDLPNNTTQLVNSKLKLLNLSSSDSIEVKNIGGCPLLWLSTNNPDISSNSEWMPLPIRDGSLPTCYPDKTSQDDSEKYLDEKIDILETSTLYDGKRLTATFKLREVPNEITPIDKPLKENPVYLFNVGIDKDNNLETGKPGQGIDYTMILQLYSKDNKVYGWVGGTSGTAMSLGKSGEVKLDKETNTITFSLDISDITPDSYLSFSASHYGTFNDNDSLCK